MKRYAIGPLHLDVEQRVLYMGSEVVALSPKSFEILLVLVENAGQVISRDAIREQVWGDAFIEDANLSNNISTLRAALRQHLGDVQPIKTFSKRGYQFTVPVTDARESGSHQLTAPAQPTTVAEPTPQSAPAAPTFLWPPATQWKTRGNLLLLVLLGAGLALTLALIHSARLGTLAQHRPASAVLSALEHANTALKSLGAIPSVLASLVSAFVAGTLVVRSRRRTDLNFGNLLLALALIVCVQIFWTVTHETIVRNTVGLLGQVLLGLTLAAYKPEQARLRGFWLFYLDLLPLFAFIVCCGLDVEKAAIYVGLSAAGRILLLVTYFIRRDALLPILVAVVGWISMAMLAAVGQYRGAAFTAIVVTTLYAAVNLTLRLPNRNVGKPILVAGTLLWALYAGTYPAAFAYAPLHTFWSLLFEVAKLLVVAGIAVLALKAEPAPAPVAPPATV